MQKFAQLIEEERKRLHAERTELVAKLSAIDQELEAIAAYEAAKTGSPLPSSGGRRSGIREAVYRQIAESQEGMTRSDVLEAMGARGDKKLEQSVSNALSALKKAERVSLVNGLYRVE